MENTTAIKILQEAANIAIKAGCFGLVEVTNIVKALEVLNAENPEADQADVLTEYLDWKAAREKEL